MKQSSNPELISIRRLLRRKAAELNVPLWRSLAEKLEKSKHRRCVVNISRINRYTREGDTVTVPGKVVGSGSLNHKVCVAAFQFSDTARKKIEEAGGRCLYFSTLIKENDLGKNVRIIG